MQNNLESDSRTSVMHVNSENACFLQHKFINPAFELSDPALISQIPNNEFSSAASADYDPDDFVNSEISVVLETVFDDHRIYLTEKVFRPIACGHPFVLAAGPGALEYIRSYGFKTFGDYWDEGYDGLVDPGDRVGAVVKIVEDLSNLTHTQQQNMRRDMQHIVEHNFNHLFIELRPYVVAEMTTNIAQALKSQNISYDPGDLLKLYRLLVN
jgi:hypothetical protein